MVPPGDGGVKGMLSNGGDEKADNGAPGFEGVLRANEVNQEFSSRAS